MSWRAASSCSGKPASNISGDSSGDSTATTAPGQINTNRIARFALLEDQSRKPVASVEQASTPPRIAVTSPNGKETWIKGTTYTITWTGNISGDVKIRLLSGDRKTVAIIAPAIPSSGSFDWTIPASLADGNYKVKIDSLEDRTVQDQSDARFTGRAS